MIDFEQAKRALEKAAQQNEKHGTCETSETFHKARADLLEARNAILKAECKQLAAKIEQLKNIARAPSYDKPMTAKQRAEALFNDAGE